jgi:hypothetical protein
VETRIPGGLLGAPERLVLEFPLTETVTISDLIRAKIEEEAKNLAAQTVLDGQSRPNRLGREYRSVERERVSQPIDLPTEVRNAQQAFAAGRFLILVDGQRYTRLDEQVMLKLQSTVRFIRLMPLTGG